MTNASQSCPPGLRIYQSGVVRACGRPESFSGSCTSVEFPSNGISYSQVCGRVIGYQVGTTDAVGIGHNRGNGGLNSYYVDGISITRGSPRVHVWTAMAGWSGKSMTDSLYCCPCSIGCHKLYQNLLEIISFMNRVINMIAIQMVFMKLILFGMAKVVVLLKGIAVQFLVSHGFTKTTLTLPLLTTLN